MQCVELALLLAQGLLCSNVQLRPRFDVDDQALHFNPCTTLLLPVQPPLAAATFLRQLVSSRF